MNREKLIFNELWQSIFVKGRVLYIGQLLQRAAKKYAIKTALICEDKKITFKKLFEKSLAFTSFLKYKGIKPRDKVILLYENSINFYIAYFGILQAGAVIVPINIFLKQKEIEHIVDDCEPKAIVVSSEFHEKVNEIKTKKTFIITEKDINELKKSNDEQPYCLEDDELVVLLYTSGTTGVPKGVMLSSRNIITNILQALSRLTLESERVLAVLPLFHSFAQNTCVWGAMFAGATVVVVSKITKNAVLKSLQHKPTIFLGVPAFYGLLCLLKTAPIEDATLFVSGGDSLPTKISSAFSIIYGRKICNGYGLTEASPIISVNIDDEYEDSGCVGRPLPNIACSIRDSKGRKLQDGQDGELWVKGQNIMLGYYKAEDATNKVLKRGWLDTGDRAYINENGKIVICGREKDLIIHKGLNIYPPEVENVLMNYPLVIEAAVIGRPDDMQGEVPVAFVVLKDKKVDTDKIEKELKVLCLKQLASYKIPKKIKVVHELPKTALHKIDKKVLRKQILDD